MVLLSKEKEKKMIRFKRIVDFKTGSKETVTVGVGTTLYTRAETERVMSDIWETVNRAYYWNAEKGKLDNTYISDREDTEIVIDGNVDAVAEEMRKAYYPRYVEKFTAEAEYDASKPMRGSEVKVVRGKSHRGAVGKVVVSIEREYNMGYRSSLETKFGIALDDEMTTYVAKNGKTYPTHKNIAWVWARNCEVINPKIDEKAIAAKALDRVEIDIETLRRLSAGGKY
jgi:hypothetical protein